MRTGRFKVDKRMASWLDEFKTFGKDKGVLQVDSFPLMAATRYAIANLTYARQIKQASQKFQQPKVAMI